MSTWPNRVMICYLTWTKPFYLKIYGHVGDSLIKHFTPHNDSSLLCSHNQLHLCFSQVRSRRWQQKQDKVVVWDSKLWLDLELYVRQYL